VALKVIKAVLYPKSQVLKQEGILYQTEFVNNTFIDLLLYAILKKGWGKSI
jgi:RimJ/RimL family protein N-acetyltransferase